MADSSGYTSAQIIAMQRDAVRRVNEMQRIAREKLNQTQASFAGNSYQQSTASSNRHDNTIHPGPHHPPSSGRQAKNDPSETPSQESLESIPSVQAEVMPNGFQGFLQRLNLDHEKLLLILLLILLVNEGSDVKLILALVYILL